jgi:hypothetical protein
MISNSKPPLTILTGLIPLLQLRDLSPELQLRDLSPEKQKMKENYLLPAADYKSIHRSLTKIINRGHC